MRNKLLTFLLLSPQLFFVHSMLPMTEALSDLGTQIDAAVQDLRKLSNAQLALTRFKNSYQSVAAYPKDAVKTYEIEIESLKMLSDALQGEASFNKATASKLVNVLPIIFSVWSRKVRPDVKSKALDLIRSALSRISDGTLYWPRQELRDLEERLLDIKEKYSEAMDSELRKQLDDTLTNIDGALMQFGPLTQPEPAVSTLPSPLPTKPEVPAAPQIGRTVTRPQPQRGTLTQEVIEEYVPGPGEYEYSGKQQYAVTQLPQPQQAVSYPAPALTPETGALVPYRAGEVVPYREPLTPETGALVPYQKPLTPETGALVPYQGPRVPPASLADLAAQLIQLTQKVQMLRAAMPR